jgi:hypothetical protein
MKIDALLEIDCNNYANLGIDSTKAEKLEVKKMSRQIYRAIKTKNPVWGERFLRTMDK